MKDGVLSKEIHLVNTPKKSLLRYVVVPFFFQRFSADSRLLL